MVEFLSSWAKSLGLAIIVISILEMLLPNNKTKKYVRMIFGIYILFNIVSPFIKNKDVISASTYDLNQYTNYAIDEKISNETTMKTKIEEIYVDELEKDITKKIDDMGYKVITCNVYATLSSNQEENYIEKIKLTIERDAKQNTEEDRNKETIEDKLVEEIQKIKPINTTIKKENTETSDSENQTQNLSSSDIQKIKKFLIEEYGVEEKCLEIN